MIRKTETTVCDRCHRDIEPPETPMGISLTVGSVVVALDHACPKCVARAEGLAKLIGPLKAERSPRKTREAT